MTHPESGPSAEHERSLDTKLIGAIGRADDLVARYIRDDIGVNRYEAFQVQSALEAELDASLNPETVSSQADMVRDEIEKRAAQRGLNYLDKGYDSQTAQTYGRQDAVFEVVSEMIPDDSKAYLKSSGKIIDRFNRLFDQKLNNGFELASLGKMITLSGVINENVKIRMVYEIKGEVIEKKAFVLPPAVYGVDTELSTPVLANGVDLIKLENEVLTALEQVIAELDALQE